MKKILSIVTFASMIPLAYAGVSSEMKSTSDKLPCDNTEYPVAVSVNDYNEDAGTPIRLNNNVKTTITATNTKTSMDQVVDTYTNSVTLSLGSDFALPTGVDKGTIGYQWTNSKSYTNGTSVAFAQSQAINLTPKIDNMTATPTFFKKQIWGSYQKCDSKTKKVTKTSSDKALKLDVVVAQGWILKCPKNQNDVCKPTDYKSN